MRDGETTRARRKALARRIAIEVHLEGVHGVSITGDFNRWARSGVPLSTDGNGTWRTALDLAPGEYQYRLLVDGQWRDNPEASKRVPNPYGSENCILVVT